MTPPKKKPATSPSREGQVGLSIPRELRDEAKAVRLHLTVGRAPTFSRYLLNAVLEECTRLELAHNGGKPWPLATKAQSQHAGYGRGKATGIDKVLVSTYPSPAEAGRIRGTAVAMRMSVSDLATTGITTRVEADRAETADGPDR